LIAILSFQAVDGSPLQVFGIQLSQPLFAWPMGASELLHCESVLHMLISFAVLFVCLSAARMEPVADLFGLQNFIKTCCKGQVEKDLLWQCQWHEPHGM
jgi:hypothetical protein